MVVKELPLTPIFHQLIVSTKKLNYQFVFLNIGGISNVTIVKKNGYSDLFSRDIGPGNCLIDEWIRKILIKNLIIMGN